MKKFFGILTEIGEAKQAKAMALGKTLRITEIEVGDGGGENAPLPTPDPKQKNLINSRHRAPINQLRVDPNNANYMIAEQIIFENEGGWWVREMGARDEDGDLVAVSNCAPSYKPLLAEGSGRHQVVRMVFMVASAGVFELKVDPTVVLATRQYVDEISSHLLGKEDTAKAAEKLSTGREISITGPFQTDIVLFDGSNDVKLKANAIEPDSFVIGDGENPVKSLTVAQTREVLDVPAGTPTRIVVTQTGALTIPPGWLGKSVVAHLVGGGGGGGGGAGGYPKYGGGGGGGGGAAQWKTVHVVLPNTPTILCTIGAGGTAGPGGGDYGGDGTSGGVTSLGSLVSANGGGPGTGAGGTSSINRPFPGPCGYGASAGGTGAAGPSVGVPGNGGTGGSTPHGRGGAGGSRSGSLNMPGNPGFFPPDSNSGAGGGGGGGGLESGAGGAGSPGAPGQIILERA